MRCKNCGSQNSDNANICANCGAALNDKKVKQPIKQGGAKKGPDLETLKIVVVVIALIAVVVATLVTIFLTRDDRAKNNETMAATTAFSEQKTTVRQYHQPTKPYTQSETKPTQTTTAEPETEPKTTEEQTETPTEQKPTEIETQEPIEQ